VSRKRFISLFSIFFFLVVFYFVTTDIALGKTAGEVLMQFQGLQGGAREAQLVAAAKRDGKIVLYGTTNIAVMQELLERFKKKYPFLQVDNYRATTNRVYAKVVAEARSGTHAVDVIEISPDSAFKLKQDHLLDPYLSPVRKSILEGYTDKEGYWTGYFHQVIALGYNTANVKKNEVPKTYEDFLNPSYRGKLSLGTADQELFGTLLEFWGKEKTLAYFNKLAKNAPAMREGHTLQAQLLSAGEFAIAPWLLGHNLAELKRKGAPVETVLLEPVLSTPKYVLLAKHSAHPHAAALMIDWMLSEGQEILVGKFGRNSTTPGLKHLFPELVRSKYLVVNPEKFGPQYADYVRWYCEIFRHC
jgi:iron(III) transport system substrate-binding protein